MGKKTPTAQQLADDMWKEGGGKLLDALVALHHKKFPELSPDANIALRDRPND